MRDHDRGSPAGPTPDGLADRPLRFGVDAGRGLIEDQDRRIEEQGTGDREPLPFAAGKPGAPFAQLRLVGERHPHDEFVGIGVPGGQGGSVPAWRVELP